mmetsp:Transcript_38629/g.75486  ORF Transcript_38629/g.75486 Transcript_38629/m.75486 type:complete len:120 (+) Transcript_38629:53-412(+)
MLRAAAFVALAGSAAAFAPTMSAEVGRRQAIAGAGVAAGVAVALPLRTDAKIDNKLRAPIVTVFDARGCTEHKNRESKGPKTGGIDDEMCVKVQYEKIAACEDTAFLVLKECLSEMKSR